MNLTKCVYVCVYTCTNIYLFIYCLTSIVFAHSKFGYVACTVLLSIISGGWMDALLTRLSTSADAALPVRQSVCKVQKLNTHVLAQPGPIGEAR